MFTILVGIGQVISDWTGFRGSYHSAPAVPSIRPVSYAVALWAESQVGDENYGCAERVWEGEARRDGCFAFLPNAFVDGRRYELRITPTEMTLRPLSPLDTRLVGYWTGGAQVYGPFR